MERSWYWRSGSSSPSSLVALAARARAGSTSSSRPSERNDRAPTSSRCPGWAPDAKKHLNLGLDLQGGIHLAMGVDVDRAVKAKVARRADEIADFLKAKKVPFDATAADRTAASASR